MEKHTCKHCEDAVGAPQLAMNIRDATDGRKAALKLALGFARTYEEHGIDCCAGLYEDAARIIKGRRY